MFLATKRASNFCNEIPKSIPQLGLLGIKLRPNLLVPFSPLHVHATPIMSNYPSSVEATRNVSASIDLVWIKKVPGATFSMTIKKWEPVSPAEYEFSFFFCVFKRREKSNVM